MVISEKVKMVGRMIKSIVRFIAYAIGMFVITGAIGYALYQRPQGSSALKAAAVHHEFLAQGSELERRIKNCNDQIDNINPELVSGAALHCALMWMQMKRFQTFVGQMHIQDPDVQPLIEGSLRAAARYAEYQTAINNPGFKPSPHDVE